MAEVNQELMYELLRKMHQRIDKIDVSLGEIRSEMHSMRGTMISMQQDIHNIYGVLARHEDRLERIENRLELRELAEAQARFEPHP
jgi:tetrahydromethanopterin S-methyltransferase subunit G